MRVLYGFMVAGLFLGVLKLAEALAIARLGISELDATSLPVARGG